MSPKTPVTLLGAGLAGSLLAVYLAKRRYEVVVYERLPDMRRHEIPAGRSINLALAHRGIRALEGVGLMPKVQQLLIPMRGRMLHDKAGATSLTPYGRTPAEVIHSVSRPGLNMLLMDAAEAAGVRFHFGQRVTDVDFDVGQVHLVEEPGGRRHQVRAATLIATDGGGSAVRQAMVRRRGVKVVEDILPHAYKELTIPAGPDGSHRMEKHALHIWPRGGYMLIALPNLDGSFTVTLFLAREGDPSFARLDQPGELKRFFASEFPDTVALIPDLEQEFRAHPTGIMGTVHTEHWHAAGGALLLGDAAHAIVPFHGQGMNCAFEDCLVLDECIGRRGEDWSKAFGEFESLRRPNAEAIAAMALENYVEMRDAVRDPKFMLQKKLGFLLEERNPGVFVPRYSMVMFHHLPYSDARHRGAIQQRILDSLTEGVTDVEQIDLAKADAVVRAELGGLERVR
ncbi:MAG TPA: NAD(P)/FAD-dependent oxidoreductase [Gammaproteobacteria bacterium]|nr:NAD(P)/FAD-dependent oxidoreductase [Gammaproteobacteria bacterium]